MPERCHGLPGVHGHPAEGRRLQVRVIDDDPSVRDVVRYLLEDFGYHCEVAAEGLRGLARFEEGGGNLVLTDLAMPEMSGWEVVEAIRERPSTMPIVLITGWWTLRRCGAPLSKACGLSRSRFVRTR
jgi:DNA-binding NtrC family response regulator